MNWTSPVRLSKTALIDQAEKVSTIDQNLTNFVDGIRWCRRGYRAGTCRRLSWWRLRYKFGTCTTTSRIICFISVRRLGLNVTSASSMSCQKPEIGLVQVQGSVDELLKPVRQHVDVAGIVEGERVGPLDVVDISRYNLQEIRVLILKPTLYAFPTQVNASI